jgi:hypothetical protein
VPDPELLQRAADLGQLALRDPAAGFGRDEVMAAAVSLELHEQAVPRDHLDQAAKAGARVRLGDEKRREQLAGRIVERDHQIERRLAFEPGVLGRVLVQRVARRGRPDLCRCLACDGLAAHVSRA